MGTIANDEQRELNEILAARGFVPSQFEASIEDDDVLVPGRVSVWTGHTVIVQRTGTPKLGRYHEGGGEDSWLVIFEKQLVAEKFGKP
jgi:hypothetical protein